MTLHVKCFFSIILIIYVIIISNKFILIFKITLLKIIDYYTLINLFLALISLIIIKNLKIKRKRKIILIVILILEIL